MQRTMPARSKQKNQCRRIFLGRPKGPSLADCGDHTSRNSVGDISPTPPAQQKTDVLLERGVELKHIRDGLCEPAVQIAGVLFPRAVPYGSRTPVFPQHLRVPSRKGGGLCLVRKGNHAPWDRSPGHRESVGTNYGSAGAIVPPWKPSVMRPWGDRGGRAPVESVRD